MTAFELAMRTAGPDWIYCFDADERPELDLTGIEFKDHSGIRLRLFDFYITPDDEHQDWKSRTWVGPEYRDILMFFNAKRVTGFPDREPILDYGDRLLFKGFVRHYGKAMSVEEWEATCRYYGHHLPEPYQSKWLNRMGKAVKRDFKSDFGNKLIKWNGQLTVGIPITGDIHALERRRNAQS